MTADILPFPNCSYADGETWQGPTGAVMQEISEQFQRLDDAVAQFPYGSEFDPRAGVDQQTLDELPVALRMLIEAIDIIKRASERESKYSLDNGWPEPS